MTMARRYLIAEEGVSGVYHCVVRCVRRAFLCGEDSYSGQNYDHRKEWIRNRLGLLADSFGIEIFTYAVMSNHLHVIVRTRPDRVANWSDREVAERWLSVYVPRHVKQKGIPVYEVREQDIERLLEDHERIAKLRSRLSNLSWMMKALNEHIARRANREDECTGRFWESRFKSQRLENEAALLACMCYVDLNPVRAMLAEGLEDSVFTGVHDRITAQKAAGRLCATTETEDLTDNERGKSEETLKKAIAWRAKMIDLNGPESPFYNIDERRYLELADWTGRRIRSDKCGVIAPNVRALLEGIELDADEWVQNIRRYNTLFGSIAGSIDQLRKIAGKSGLRWLKGCRKAAILFRYSDKQPLPT